MHRGHPPSGPDLDDARGDAPEPHRASRCGGDRARPVRRDRHRDGRGPARRRAERRARRTDRGPQPGHPLCGERARAPRRPRAAVGTGARCEHDCRHRAGYPGDPAACRRRGDDVRHRRVRRAGGGRGSGGVRPSRPRARGVDRRTRECGVSIPPRSRARCVARRPRAPSPPPDPPRRREPSHRPARVGGAHRSPPTPIRCHGRSGPVPPARRGDGSGRRRVPGRARAR